MTIDEERAARIAELRKANRKRNQEWRKQDEAKAREEDGAPF